MDMDLNAAGVSAGAVDLDELERLLESDATPEQSMWLSELDGFLTGIAAGPEVIPPSEFLPVVWGVDGVGPRDEGQSSEPVVLLILGRLEEIRATLQRGPEEISPLFWENEDGTEDAGDWVEGFLQAVDLREDAWMPITVHRRDRSLLTPILSLARDEEGGPLLLLEEGEEELSEETRAEALDMVGVCVAGIYAFWRVRESRVQPIVRASEPGRNDACLCGSGKKYKKCCGG